MTALNVDYASLPDKAGSKPKAKVQPKAPTASGPVSRVDTIRDRGKVLCYYVRVPSPVFFIQQSEAWDTLKQALPSLKRSQVLTLKRG
jgi:hypothetical protein